MPLKMKWIGAVLGVGALIACMKAGDGVGLDAAGRICTDDSKDSACLPYIDPCKAHPNLPSCQVDPCVANPASQACSTSICAKDPSRPWCQVSGTDCAKTPAEKICADSCLANPDLSWCKVDCAANPTAPGCVDSCAANPALPGCAPKTKFAEVYAVIQANACASCHSGTGLGATTGKLNMGTLDSAFANLVGVLATNQTMAPGWKRVVPGLPDSSVLYWKVAATSTAVKLAGTKNYLSRMPLDLAPISKADIDLIKKWIQDGALK